MTQSITGLQSPSSTSETALLRIGSRVIKTAQAVGIGYVPGVLHYNDMVNSDSSPWIQMLQTAIFNGDVDGAVKTARDAMESIASQ